MKARRNWEQTRMASAAVPSKFLDFTSYYLFLEWNFEGKCVLWTEDCESMHRRTKKVSKRHFEARNTS
jgi:hypothetical protein